MNINLPIGPEETAKLRPGTMTSDASNRPGSLLLSYPWNMASVLTCASEVVRLIFIQRQVHSREKQEEATRRARHLKKENKSPEVSGPLPMLHQLKPDLFVLVGTGRL